MLPRPCLQCSHLAKPPHLTQFLHTCMFWAKISANATCAKPNCPEQPDVEILCQTNVPKPNMSRLTKPFIKDVQQNVSYQNFKHSGPNNLGCLACVFCRWRSRDSSQCIRRSIILAYLVGIPRPTSETHVRSTVQFRLITPQRQSFLNTTCESMSNVPFYGAFHLQRSSSHSPSAPHNCCQARPVVSQ